MLLISERKQFEPPCTVLPRSLPSSPRRSRKSNSLPADGCAGPTLTPPYHAELCCLPVDGWDICAELGCTEVSCCGLASVLHPFLVPQPIFNSQWAKTRTPSTTYRFKVWFSSKWIRQRCCNGARGRLEYQRCHQLIPALVICNKDSRSVCTSQTAMSHRDSGDLNE